jgi:LysM repeat protein
MGNEVLWSRYLDQLRLQRPEGVRFSSVALVPVGSTGSTSTGSSGAAASASSAAGSTTTPGAIATLTISGKAASQPDVASLLDQLAKIRGFTGVYLSSTSGDSNASVITYTVTAGVTAEALSHRYTVEGQ